MRQLYFLQTQVINRKCRFGFSKHRRAFMMATDTQAKKRPVGRRYVIACDGTWQNSDTGVDKPLFGEATVQVPSNVTRIVRAIRHTDGPVEQIIYYQRGVGTDDGSAYNSAVGGLTGGGITEHIREAYGFLSNNYFPETQADLTDEKKALNEIILLGFSRGAFTARAIASIISDVGLLTKKGMEHFWGIFEDWKGQDVAGKQSRWYEMTYGEKGVKFTDKKYRQKLIDDGFTRYGMSIRAVGVWDTVGALGVPLPWNAKNVKEFSFVNTKVAQKVQHAFHAVALDEQRNLFSPTLWEEPDQPHQLKALKQVWFPGVHSNVGGSYSDAGMSNITLAWMVSQLEDTDGGIVAFNPDYLDFVQDLNTKQYSRVPEPVRPWGMGRLYDSTPDYTLKGLFQGVKPITRTPGRYHKVSNVDGKETKVNLKGTGESIHRCVRVRGVGGGWDIENNSDTSEITRLVDLAKTWAGYNVKEKYKCEALAGFEAVLPGNGVVGGDDLSQNSGVVWKGKDGTVLPEAALGRTELRLLKRSIETAGAAAKNA